jgi:opacity protein-like surface antigen
MVIRKTLMASVLVFFLCVNIGLAQNGFFLGFQAGTSSQKLSFNDFEFDRDTTFLYGLRAGVKFLMFSVEANYFQTAHNMSLSEIIGFSWEERKVNYNYIGLNLKYYFSLLLLQPYLTFGLGYYTADVHEIDKDTDRGYNLGVGVEISLGKKIALMGEAKYHRVKLLIDDEEFKVGDFSLVGGMSFYF